MDATNLSSRIMTFFPIAIALIKHAYGLQIVSKEFLIVLYSIRVHLGVENGADILVPDSIRFLKWHETNRGSEYE